MKKLLLAFFALALLSEPAMAQDHHKHHHHHAHHRAHHHAHHEHN